MWGQPGQESGPPDAWAWKFSLGKDRPQCCQNRGRPWFGPRTEHGECEGEKRRSLGPARPGVRGLHESPWPGGRGCRAGCQAGHRALWLRIPDSIPET